jgi:predicted metal-dependent hydrolase
MNDSPAAWPPPFAIRVSKRAKYARLCVSPGKGLEVVLPFRLRNSSAIDIVERHREWVEKTLCRFEQTTPILLQSLPDEILLRGGKLPFTVSYGQPKTAVIDTSLHIAAEKAEDEKASAILQTFARKYAYTELGKETAHISAKHGLAYTGLGFRRQKSLWGSCTAKGSIILNTCLIFLPEELAQFVIMHELAHTRHMNHGQGFWKLLFSMEENALALDKRLRSAWKYAPSWIWR